MPSPVRPWQLLGLAQPDPDPAAPSPCAPRSHRAWVASWRTKPAGHSDQEMRSCRAKRRARRSSSSLHGAR